MSDDLIHLMIFLGAFNGITPTATVQAQDAPSETTPHTGMAATQGSTSRPDGNARCRDYDELAAPPAAARQ